MKPESAILPAGPLRVLVVDDDATYRHIISRILESLPDVEVAGTASTLAIARRRIEQGGVDAITLDCVLRDEDGLELLSWLKKERRTTPVVLLTAGQNKSACKAVDALLLGASGIVIKPTGADAKEELRKALQRELSVASAHTSGRPVSAAAPTLSVHPRERELIAVGASTGGPPVVLQFLRDLPERFDVPIVITQHMHASHLGYFVELVASQSRRKVIAGTQGVVVQPGHVYVAARQTHLTVERRDVRLIIIEDDGPEEHHCKPAVDPMFRSVARACGEASVGVVMTGMGTDGASGAAALRAVGAPVVVQDEATSVVWGMPGATVKQGAASKVVPGPHLAQCVLEWTTGRNVARRIPKS